MDKQTIAHFEQHYAGLPEEDLERLQANGAALVEEAQVALGTVIAQRGVNIAQMRATNVRQDEQRTTAERSAAEHKAKRDAKLFKWFLILAIPVGVIRTLLNPEAAWQTFVSSLVQALGLAAIVWVVLCVKRKFVGKADAARD